MKKLLVAVSISLFLSAPSFAAVPKAPQLDSCPSMIPNFRQHPWTMPSMFGDFRAVAEWFAMKLRWMYPGFEQ